jgi:hypothetical protein
MADMLVDGSVCRSLTFHIVIFSSETARPNEVKFGRKHLWKVLSKYYLFCPDPSTSMSARTRFLEIDQLETRIANGSHIC